MTSVQQAGSASIMTATAGTTGAAVFSTGILGGSQAGTGVQGLFGLLLAMLGGQSGADGSALSGLLNAKTGTPAAGLLSGLLSGKSGLLAGSGMASTQLTPNALAALLKGAGNSAGQGAASLLAMLQQLAAQGADGQNLPTDTANLAATLSPADLMAALQSTPKGQVLASLLSRASSLEDLQAKAAALSDADKKDALDSLAALLAGLQVMQAPQIVAQVPVASDAAGDTTAAEADAAAAQKSTALQTLADFLQKQLAGADKGDAAASAVQQNKQDGQSLAAHKAVMDKIMQTSLEKAHAILGSLSATASDQQTVDAALMQHIQAALGEARRQNSHDTTVSDDSASHQSAIPSVTGPVQTAADMMAKAQAAQNKATGVSSGEAVSQKSDSLSGVAALTGDGASGVAATPAASTTDPGAHKGAFEALLKETGAVNAKATDSANVKFDKHGAHIPVSDQVALRLSKASQDGDSRITIKLVPAELGRIDVRLDVATDGRVTAHFQVEQSSTLDLLQKDTKGLERALSDAGLKMDSQSLNFNMRGGDQRQAGTHGQNMQQGSGQGQNQQGQTPAERAAQLASEATGTDLELSWVMNPSRVNVRV